MLKLALRSLMFCFLLVVGKNIYASEKPTINEYWQEFYIFRSFTEKISGEILFNNLYSKQLGNYDWFAEGKIAWYAKSWLKLELMYRHEYYAENDAMVLESRPMFRVSGTKKIGNWKIRNRHRLEYRKFELGGDHFRYRNDLKISPGFDWTTLKINPYLIEEIFIAKGMMTRNRIYAGIEGQRGRFEPGLYYLLQSNNKVNNWDNVNIIGFILGIEI